ncbi:MAG: nitrogen regulation protein NR(II) [Gammaproteobacteria bacterium]|nr:nitrogen regulation protein NR(II) [Gammaproteobacteria bacterium]MCY4323240.1 nitrogen regulation protein NR(II) [Gammaproteobacteria bacterium]
MNAPVKIRLPSGMFAENVIDQMRTPLIVLEERLNVVFVNQAAEQLIGNSRQHICGQPLLDWIQVDGACLRSEFEQVLRGDSLFHRRANLSITGANALVSDYSITSYEQVDGLYLLLEILPLDRFARIERSNERHSRTEQMHELARGVAHEIKNPLGGILGAAQLLEHDLVCGEQRDYTGIILGEVQRLGRMVDQMLLPGSLPTLGDTNIHEVLEHSIRVLGLTEHDGVDFKRDYDPSLPDIQADREMLIQAVLNILRNAMQAVRGVPSPNICVKTSVTSKLTIDSLMHRQVLSIHIRDNGCGVPIELNETLFVPLIKGPSGGTGLGLSLAHHIVSIHGGMIEFVSEFGDTCFSIHLPIERESSS